MPLRDGEIWKRMSIKVTMGCERQNGVVRSTLSDGKEKTGKLPVLMKKYAADCKPDWM